MFIIGLTLICLIPLTTSQQISPENAGKRVAASLVECYNNTLYVTRDYRPPATINIFINLLRKLEEGNIQLTTQQLAIATVQRFRQDGIWFSKAADPTVGLPYSPRAQEAHKNRLQLKKLTPGSALSLRNDSLSALERCSLHFMVSSVIDSHLRGDENQVCSKLMHYTSRIRRDTDTTESEVTDILSADVFSGGAISTCPLEGGVIYTKWGTIKGGLLLSGLAAGLEHQQVTVSPGQTADNIYASTIGGELSEVSIGDSSATKHVGNPGGWNSTAMPKYYFIEKSNKTYGFLTDAEIRGGLDGLYLGLGIQDWRSRVNNIKLSQIVDMYYSRRGVFGGPKACDRKALAANWTSSDKLRTEVERFNNILDDEYPSDITFDADKLKIQADKSVEAFNSYLPQLADLDCSSEDPINERVAADVALFLDTAWNYKTIASVISSTLDNIDVNRYETTYTIYYGSQTDILVNKTYNLLDFYQRYNESLHKAVSGGFNYKKVFETIEHHYKVNLDNITEFSGQAFVAILLPHNTPTDDDKQFIRQKIDGEFRSKLPDLRILAVVPGGNNQGYGDLVLNANNDVFALTESSDPSDDSQIKTTVSSVVSRMKKIPRNIVNPHCGSAYKSGSSSFQVTLYAEPATINFYKISPNYYASGKTLKISGQGYGEITVCYSLTETSPRDNSTGVQCKNINSNAESMEIDISGFCTGSVSSCSPIYISAKGTTSNLRCTSSADRCRFPDNIRFTVALENVECSSGVNIFVGIFTIFVCVVFLTVMNF